VAIKPNDMKMAAKEPSPPRKAMPAILWSWSWPPPARRFFRNRKLVQAGALRAKRAQNKLKPRVPGKIFGF